MFGFLRKSARISSAVSASADVTADVTSSATADVTAPMTEDVAPPVAPQRIIEKWAEPKPFPEPDSSSPSRTVQIWPLHDLPLRYPTAKEIAEELFIAMQKQPTCAGKWVLAMCIEGVIYPMVCEDLGWPQRPWMGKNGVAAHFAKLSPLPPRCFRVELDGRLHNLAHYFIPGLQTAAVTEIANHRRTA
jgi:hypothetical protein